MPRTRRRLEAIAYHRNGISGAPFYVLTFCDDNGPMVAVCFGTSDDCATPREIRTAVLNRDMLAQGEIGFGTNSWRGDDYHGWCWEQIRAHEAAEREKWAASPGFLAQYFGVEA